MIETYLNLKKEEPVLNNCFFAFSNQQLSEGLRKFNLDIKDICAYGSGLYGTREGIKEMMDFYDKRIERIAEQCDPQEVYNYEFHNHECNYTNDDTEVMKIIVSTFGEERSKDVKRKFGYTKIEKLFIHG